MSTYKIGNQVKCIVRSVCAGELGGVTMTYSNQPYTVINTVDASISFANIDRSLRSGFNDLVYHTEAASEIKLSNVLLTDRILNLIFPKSEAKTCNVSENYTTDDTGTIYLNLPAATTTIYQVFIYDAAQTLVRAYGTYSQDTITGLTANTNYLIFYSYEGTYSLVTSQRDNVYVMIDLEISNNVDDSINKTFMHFDKCAVAIDKNMYFRGTSNSVDLIFKVISTDEDYITLK